MYYFLFVVGMLILIPIYRYSKKAEELKRIMESNCEDSNAHIEYIRLRRRVNILSGIEFLLMLVFAILYQF
ncbi:MAG: hypothetical protein KIC66_05450 [Clostridium sp.]|uniref:hypothetical protein n=1 Tax=Clostridium sp. TaxID=1506 RepID=UPI0025C3C2DF|nr:hypothetical protein [Clostridium sp.]MBS5926519.1 hypothetical protein [Clostridium sp.]